MATTQNTYTGNGSTTNYSFTFPYLKTTDIKVSLDAVVTTAYSLPNATTIDFSTAPANGVVIRIYRDTNVDVLEATFNPGSAIKAEDLNNNFEQNNYSVQESKSQASQAPTALANSVIAVNTANQAAANATSALSAVNNVVSAQVVVDVTALNALNTNSLSTNDQVSVSNSTGIEGVATLTGEPAGFVGASDLRVRLIWNGAGWTYQFYEAIDPDSRYVLNNTGTVTTTNIANDAVTSAQLAANSVTTPKIQDNAVTTAKIADANVTTSKLVDANVTTAKIADTNVTTPKIADANVTAAKIASGAVTQTKLDANSVITAKIQNGAVTVPKLESPLSGDLTFAATQTFPTVPANTKSSAYTLVLSDAGKHINITNGGVTVPSGIFSTGAAISIYNNSGNDQTITQGSGTTLRKVGTADTGNRTLAQYGLVTILCVASNTFVVVGGGLS
jgi:hypothetical protein